MRKSIEFAIATAVCLITAWVVWQPPFSLWWFSIVMGLLGIAFFVGAIYWIGEGE
jgi:hypothetical protein